MRNTSKFIGIAIIVAISFIALSLTGCPPEPTPAATETFTVTFNANGGSPTPPTQTIAKGGKAAEPQAPTKPGNDFIGWYKEEALTNQWNFADGNGVAADTVTANITLWAKWSDDNVVKERSATINPFEDKTVTVKGNFTDTEWNGVAGKIETAIQNLIIKYPTSEELIKNRYRKCEIIFVEETSEYDHWKTIGDGKTIYICLGILDSENLAIMMFTAINSIDKTDTQNHEWIWEVITAPTIDTEGLETEICSQCRQPNGTRSIPKLTSVTFSSVEDFGTWITTQPVNAAYKPYIIVLNVSNLTGIKETLINNNTKYVILDLSGSTITTIPEYAFSNSETYTGCATLVGITIPNTVTSIGQAAFWSCTNLASVTIPNTVTSIGRGAFTACGRLTSVTIPNSVTSIGERAFYNNKLTSITIPDSVTFIGEGSFAMNQLTNVIIPNSVTSIGEGYFAAWGEAIGAFSNNQLTSVTISNGVTSIGGYAFYGNKLTSVTIPNSVISIGKGAFAKNQLTSVTVPNSVTLANEVFAENPKLINAPMSASEKATAEKKAEEEQKKQAEQTRLAGLYLQAGSNFGNLKNTTKSTTRPYGWNDSLTMIYDFGDGVYNYEGRILNGLRVESQTGTFRVNGNTVIFLSSGGVYSIGTIIGNALNKDGYVYR